MLNRKIKTSGFTIVELLIVIVIIGVLAAITIVSYISISQRAVASALQSDLKNAVTKLKLYQVDNSAYPIAIDCAAIPAANTICLKPSPNNNFTDYSVNNAASPQTFRLTARNVNNTSYSITESSPPFAGGVATAPTSLSATGGVAQVSLTWVPPTSDGGSAITGYKLYRDTASSPTTLVQTLGNVTSYTNTGLAAGMTYYFRVQAINSAGDSDFSNNASAAVTALVVNRSFAYTGSVQTWTVPATDTYTIEAWGAQGSGGYGGLGGYAKGTLAVTAGEVLNIYVGGYSNGSAAGYNGGGSGGYFGGGGASDVRQGGTALTNRKIVAGGGGGAGGNYGNWASMGYGGAGGGTSGENGTVGAYGVIGYGGSQTAGGSGGGTSGSLGLGGNNGNSYGAGGGGGYYGGGGSSGYNTAGCDGACGGGAGGGSSYIGGVTAGVTTSGVRSGQGLVTIHN